MTTSQQAHTRILTVRHSGLGMGWYVMSTSAADRYDVRTVAGPYTSREQADAKAREMAAQA